MLNEQIIRTKLFTDQRWLEAAILALYDRQTNDEKQVGDTRHDNDRGFNSADARRLSYCARWLRSGRSLNGRFLNDARQRCQKYAKQLLRIAQAKAAATAQVA
jgi:hypothetical protein